MPLPRPIRSILHLVALLSLASAFYAPMHAQDQGGIKLELSSNAADRTRLAAADFKPDTSAPNTLNHTFDTVLFSDLANAGIFDMVSKSMVPQAQPGGPSDINLGQWSAAPSSASMVAFGNLAVQMSGQGARLAVNGFVASYLYKAHTF
jgi:TolB protein